MTCNECSKDRPDSQMRPDGRCCWCHRKETYIERYGVDNPSKSDAVKRQIRESCERSFGCSYSEMSKRNQSKRERTCIERYGTKTPLQNDAIKRRIRETMKQSNGYKQRAKRMSDTCLERYGVTNPRLVPAVADRVKRTCVERYGVENPYYSETVRRKVSYDYDDLRFDSSWELAFYVWLRDKRIDFKFKPSYLTYRSDGKIRRYYPDFMIDDYYVEVKGPQFFKNGRLWDPAKRCYLTLKERCMKKNNVKIMTRELMKPVLQYVHDEYGTSFMRDHRH